MRFFLLQQKHWRSRQLGAYELKTIDDASQQPRRKHIVQSLGQEGAM